MALCTKSVKALANRYWLCLSPIGLDSFSNQIPRPILNARPFSYLTDRPSDLRSMLIRSIIMDQVFLSITRLYIKRWLTVPIVFIKRYP